MIANPYGDDLGGREPVAAMKEAVERIQALTAGWTPARFERSYAPGKWSARQILAHLAQSELALGTRARMALATPDYASQAFDQDRWVPFDAAMTGQDALDALVACNRMNRAFFASLSEADRRTPFTHPQYGALDVGWILAQMAGHLRHHLAQFEIIGA